MQRRSFLIVALTVLFGSAMYLASDSLPVYSSVANDARLAVTTPTPRAQPVVTTPTASPLPAPQSSPAPAQAPVKQKPTLSPSPTSPAQVTGNSLSIPSIGFRAPITNVGLTTNNAIDVPSGMQVGMYVGAGRPGLPGAVFLDGHLGGIFSQLSKVTTGQTLSVNYSDQTYNYRVVYSEVVPLAGIDMAKALNVYGGGNEGLNLMTCAGTYIPSTGTYDKRLVVYTARVA